MRALALVVPVLLAASMLAVPPAAAANLDAGEPTNNPCGGATTAQSTYWWDTGSLSATDYSDSILLTGVVQNEVIHVEMNPAYPPTAGKNFDLYLFWQDSPGMWSSSDYSRNPGVSTETIHTVATHTGTYCIQIFWVSGSGVYDLYAYSQAQPAAQCTAEATVAASGVLAGPSCSFTTPSCGGSCTAHLSVSVEGTGIVYGQIYLIGVWAECTGALSCSDSRSYGISGYGSTMAACSAEGYLGPGWLTAAAQVKVTCRVTVT